MSRLRPHLSFSNVVALLALFAALGGSAYAVKIKLKKNQVKSKHIASTAATGDDIDESTLGKVNSAASADSATRANTAASADSATSAATAGNASSVDGVSSEDLQFGDGIDDAFAGVLETGETGGILLFEGAVGIECAAAPKIAYRDVGGDAFGTDLWVDGSYQLVGDGADATPVDPTDPDLAPFNATAKVQLWGGAGVVGDVTASVRVDETPDPDECIVAFTSQENLEDGGVVFLGGDEADDRRELESRRRLPEGWVEPRPRE